MSGKEVDSIIQSDSTDAAVKNGSRNSYRENRYRAEELAEERILDVLIPPAKNNWGQAEQKQQEPCRPSNVPAKNCAKASSTIKRSRLTRRRADGRRDYGASGHGRNDQPVAVYVPVPGGQKTETA